MTERSPRWLSDSEQETWRAFLRASRLLEVALDAQMQQEQQMPTAHYLILAMLSEADGRQLRMRDLAASTQSSRSRLTHAVDRLEQRGLVERHSCPDDRRGQVAVLTVAGWRVVAKAAPLHVDRVRQVVFDVLSPDEVVALGRISERIAGALERDFVDRGVSRARPVPSDRQR